MTEAKDDNKTYTYNKQCTVTVDGKNKWTSAEYTASWIWDAIPLLLSAYTAAVLLIICLTVYPFWYVCIAFCIQMLFIFASICGFILHSISKETTTYERR